LEGVELDLDYDMGAWSLDGPPSWLTHYLVKVSACDVKLNVAKINEIIGDASKGVCGCCFLTIKSYISKIPSVFAVHSE
jgi:hypothetical protein